MRIADIVLRQGHLAEDALLESLTTGTHNDHLDRCDQCRQRAADLGRWLDQVRTVAVDAADDAFPPEKLERQRAQILRKLEQLDEPSRVIAFPTQVVPLSRSESDHRVAPAWLGVAAAAGLVIGLLGGQFAGSVLPGQTPAQPPAPVIATPQNVEPVNASLLDYDFDRYVVPDALLAIDQITPAPAYYTPPPR